MLAVYWRNDIMQLLFDGCCVAADASAAAALRWRAERIVCDCGWLAGWPCGVVDDDSCRD